METPTPVKTIKRWLPSGQRRNAVWLAAAVLVMLVIFLGVRALQNRDTSPAADKNHAVINLTGEGWDPAIVRVRKGTRVTWTNTLDKTYGVLPADVSGDKAQSAPYGNESIAPHGTYDHTFTKTGTYTFKEPQNPTITGTVVVVDE